MSRDTELAAAFDAARPRLIRVAYAVLGSRVEAEDVVSDCWLRLSAADAEEPIRDVDAWSTTVVARAALDALRSARVRREVYVGPWLPEPIVEVAAATDGPPDPADRVTLDDRVSFAVLVVLERLTPAERTAWVLHDLFGLPFADIADIVGRSPAAVRQLAARARTHVDEGAPRITVDAAQHAAAVRKFLGAAVGGDLRALVAALDPDVVLTSDGGGQVNAARHPVVGADRVTRFLYGIATLMAPTEHVELVSVNGEPGIGVFDGDRLTTVMSLTTSSGRIMRVDVIRNPDKLVRWS
jgi:RNA polymerase sigma-70 factor, ECF subfamily